MTAAFDVPKIARESAEREARIWEILGRELRRVGRAPYAELASQIAAAKRKETRVVVEPGRDVRKETRGRRPSNAQNAMK